MMSGELTLTYKLVIFDASSKMDADFERAIEIYQNETAAELRTEPDEIRRWRHNYDSSFYPDKLFQVGLYIRKTVIGFCQFVYLHREKIIFVDYMAIAKEHRKNNSFFAFVDLIRGYIAQRNMFYDFIVTEVGFLDASGIPDGGSRALVRMLKNQGFLVTGCAYMQPQLGVHNAESRMQAWLLIHPRRQEMDALPASILTRIVEAIYIDHYLRWYEAILAPKDFINYRNDIMALLEKFRSSIPKNKVVPLVGYRSIRADGEVDAAYLVEERVRYRNYFIVPAAISATLIFVAAALRKYLEFTIYEIAALYGIVVVTTLVLLSTVSRRAGEMVRYLIENGVKFLHSKR